MLARLQQQCDRDEEAALEGADFQQVGPDAAGALPPDEMAADRRGKA